MGGVVDAGATPPGKRRPSGIKKALALGPMLECPIVVNINGAHPETTGHNPQQFAVVVTVSGW